MEKDGQNVWAENSMANYQPQELDFYMLPEVSVCS